MTKVTKFKRDMKRYGNLFPFYIPAAVFTIIFSYIPLAGIILAFKENPSLIAEPPIQAVLHADWVGLENFKEIFAYPEFITALKNTLIISLMKIVITFPLPIILALLLTETAHCYMKKPLEFVMYIPYFLSWSIVGGIFITILKSDTGFFNNMLAALGVSRYPWLQSNTSFRWTLVIMQIWKDVGWSAIVYVAAIAGLDTATVEAARIDGASKVQQITHVVLPGIMDTIAVMFILRFASLLDAGFEQIYVVYSGYVQDSGYILGLYSYNSLIGTVKPEYGLSTAIGLFNSLVGFILTIGGNALSKRFFHRSIW